MDGASLHVVYTVLAMHTGSRERNCTGPRDDSTPVYAGLLCILPVLCTNQDEKQVKKYGSN